MPKAKICFCGHPKRVHSAHGCVGCLKESPEKDICYCFEEKDEKVKEKRHS